MKFNKAFFENTRLGILTKAALVSDAKGSTQYFNRPFVKLFRNEADIKREISEAGLQDSVLSKNDITLFGEDMTVYIENGEPSFPIIEDRNIYFLIETAEFNIKLPLFGGKVNICEKCESDAATKTAEPVADVSIDYFPVDTVFERVSKNLREKSCHRGRRLEFDETDTSGMICKASVFDISLIMGLLVEAMFGLSSDKTVTVSAVKIKNDFVFDVSVNTERHIKDGRSLISEVFNAGDDTDRAFISLESFCSLFSYHLMCRKNEKKLSIALTVPVHSMVSVNFRNEDKDRMSDAADRAAQLY